MSLNLEENFAAFFGAGDDAPKKTPTSTAGDILDIAAHFAARAGLLDELEEQKRLSREEELLEAAKLIKNFMANPPTGTAGEQGPQGLQGVPGKSAYQLAQDSGFTGSTDEWLASLIGRPGEDGQDGGAGAGGGNLSATTPIPGYTATFAAGSWVADGAEFRLDVAVGTHGQGTTPSVKVYVPSTRNVGELALVPNADVEIDTAGNVKLYGGAALASVTFQIIG